MHEEHIKLKAIHTKQVYRSILNAKVFLHHALSCVLENGQFCRTFTIFLLELHFPFTFYSVFVFRPFLTTGTERE